MTLNQPQGTGRSWPWPCGFQAEKRSHCEDGWVPDGSAAAPQPCSEPEGRRKAGFAQRALGLFSTHTQGWVVATPCPTQKSPSQMYSELWALVSIQDPESFQFLDRMPATQPRPCGDPPPCPGPP